MKKSTKIILGATTVFLLAFALFGVERWATSRAFSLEEMLKLLVQDMPADATGIVYIDVSQMRQSPFLQKVFTWAQKPQTDAEYVQFVSDTGFNYERDLNRVALSAARHGTESMWFAIADGNFDQKKIVAYLMKSGAAQKHVGDYDIYTVATPAALSPATPAPTTATSSSASRAAAPNAAAQQTTTSAPPSPAAKADPAPQHPSRMSLAFLRDGRIAATNDADLYAYLDRKGDHADPAPWQSRFTRLAGAPAFIVGRQDANTVKALAEQAPGGLQSPQLSGLMSQLTWITVALQPQQDSLRVVVEGESPNATAAKQLSDMLSGLLLLARAGFGDAKLTQQMNQPTRAAFLGLLNSADISLLDRDDLKAVRMVVEITPDILNIAKPATNPAPSPAAANSDAHTPVRSSSGNSPHPKRK
jgi:hypothetical protein